MEVAGKVSVAWEGNRAGVGTRVSERLRPEACKRRCRQNRLKVGRRGRRGRPEGGGLHGVWRCHCGVTEH